MRVVTTACRLGRGFDGSWSGRRRERTVAALAIVVMMAASGGAAERKWQTGVWGDITTTRKVVDFGPGASGFSRPGSTPEMRALADVRRFVIETDDLRIEAEDTVSVGRRSFEAITGATVTFAVEKNTVYVRDGGMEYKLRLLKKTEQPKK
jgi:hypothetical protein